VEPLGRSGGRDSSSQPDCQQHDDQQARSVRVELPPGQVEDLRADLFAGLAGALGDLQMLEKLSDPVGTAREASIFVRLLEGLDTGRIELPDEEARIRMERMARYFDDANDHESVVMTHDAQWAMVDLLGGVRDQD
jgi:hypothetical protein